MTWAPVLSDDLEPWLLAVGGRKNIRPGLKLDPFGSSLRTLSTQARPWLAAIQAGDLEASKRRSDQTLIDLRSVGLLKSGSEALTPFGESVLDRWQALPEGWNFELPLAIVMLQEGLAFEDPGCREMLEFWWDIRSVFAEEELLADREAVLLFTYLNQAVEGFNPWVALRDSGRKVSPPVPWKDFKNAVESDLARKAVTRLQGRESRRYAARVCFCRGMSLLFEAQKGHTSSYLMDLKLPFRATR